MHYPIHDRDPIVAPGLPGVVRVTIRSRTALLVLICSSLAFALQDPKEKSADELMRIGVDAYTRLDYEAAVEYLTQAQKAGAAVDSELTESKYCLCMWAGLQAEANGFKQKAVQLYQAAGEVEPSKPSPRIALRRLNESVREANEVELLALDNKDAPAVDFRQRVLTRLLKSLSTRDLELAVRNPADFDLGAGVDALSVATRQKIVSGSTDESSILTERLVASETDLSAAASVELDQATTNALSAEYGKFGFGAHGSLGTQTAVGTQSSTSIHRYTFHLLYEVITKKLSLREPKVKLDSPLLLGEWLDNYGTHFISEVLQGGWVEIALTKECRTAEEHAKLSQMIQGAMGGNIGFIQGDVSGQNQSMVALQQVISSQGLSIEARSAGASGTFEATTVAGFLSKRTAFKKEVLESDHPTAVRVRIRSYSAPEVLGFSLAKDHFATAIKRTQARTLSESIMALVRASGRAKLEAQGVKTGEILWNPQARRERQPGERYFREDSQQITTTFSAPLSQRIVQQQSSKCYRVHEVLRASDHDNWLERVHFDAWEQTSVDGKTDTSLQGHTVLVESANGRTTIKLDKTDGLSKQALDWVTGVLRAGEHSNESLFPKVPVGNLSEWVCDIHEVARPFVAGLDVDEGDSSAKGKLSNVRLEGEAYMGHMDFAIDIKLRGLNSDQVFTKDGHLKMIAAGEMSLQPQKLRSSKLVIPFKLNGVLLFKSRKLFMNVVMEGRQETREGDLSNPKK